MGGGGDVLERSSVCSITSRELRETASHLREISKALRQTSHELRRYNRKFIETYGPGKDISAAPFLIEALLLPEILV